MFGISLPSISLPNPITAVQKAVTTAVSTATTAANTAVKTVTSAPAAVAPTLTSVIKSVTPAVQVPALPTISSVISAPVRAVTTVVNTAVQTATNVATTAAKVVTSAPAAAITPLAAVVKTVTPVIAAPVAAVVAATTVNKAASTDAAAAAVTGGYPAGVTEGKISGIVKFTSAWSGKYVLVDGFGDYPSDAQQIEYADGTYSSNLRYSKSQNAVYAVGDWNIPHGVSYVDQRKVMTAPTKGTYGYDTIEILEVHPDTGAVKYRLNGANDNATDISGLKTMYPGSGALVDAWIAQHDTTAKVGTAASTGWQASNGPVPSAADPFRLNLGVITNPVTGAAAALTGAAGSIFGAASAGFGSILGGAGDAVHRAEDTLGQSVNAATGFLGGFGKAVNNIISLPTQVADKLVDGVTTSVDKVLAPITKSESMITNFWRGLREMAAKVPKIFGVSIIAIGAALVVVIILVTYGGRGKNVYSYPIPRYNQRRTNL